MSFSGIKKRINTYIQNGEFFRPGAREMKGYRKGARVETYTQVTEKTLRKIEGWSDTSIFLGNKNWVEGLSSSFLCHLSNRS